jgi:PPM family protein phosphatase
MRAVAAGLSDVGKQRVHNADQFVLLPEFNVFAVADGMGGALGAGGIVSEMAVDAIAAYFRNSDGQKRSVSDTLRAAVTQANTRIFARFPRIVTTIVAVAYDPRSSTLFIAHAGDSRCYRMRNGEILQLTRDHSPLAEALLKHPDLNESDLTSLPRNVITRALGIGPSIEVDLRAERVEMGDVYLLCSDGLHGLISDKEIASIIESPPTLADACVALIHQANRAGGKDNITAVLIRIEAGDGGYRER